MKNSLTRYAWLSIAAAIATIGLKAAAYHLTGSVSLLSDALESLVNLAGALLALAVLTVAARPPDDDHAYGHGKAEYFSSGAEGVMILLAAASIAYAAIQRLLAPRPLEQVGIGLVVTGVAALINLLAALAIRGAARKHDSVTLDANAKHLMTDVWTSAGVIAAVALVRPTGWLWLDPVVALVVAANIIREGVHIVGGSISGLMDTAISPEEHQKVEAVLDGFVSDQIKYHALRTRRAGRRRFVSVHILVPGGWTVHDGHELLENIEANIRAAIPNVTVLTHLESLDDPASWEDIGLDRKGQ
ncbi:MAG: cation transporter [Calditrichaeota bacterium]|nr:cation transporter [Calditrichota bacterium]MCB9366759.1 cation transporter [Calditrichota bacterium]MCB9391912.1 cation transporter [Calditrichota bacterium]